MGLIVNTQYGTPVVHHGGDMIGFHSDMMWLPEHGVGAVILTNGDPGWLVRTRVPPQAARGAVRRQGRGRRADRRDREGVLRRDRRRAQAARPCRPIRRGGQARRRATRTPRSATIAVTQRGATTIFDFGEWKSEVASRKNPDGTISFVTIVPGFSGLEFVVGEAQRTLTLRDAQHEYVFAGEAPPTSATR